MRELIDKLEQLDLQQLSIGDLHWIHCTGKGLTIGSGRNKKHFFRRGIQTPIGDIELSVWIKAAEYIVERDGLQEELEQLLSFASASIGSSCSRELIHARHLDMCLSKIYRNPSWVGFIPYNERYHPELLENTPMVEVIMGCCETVCTIPKAQIHDENQTAHCPVCRRWASFTCAKNKKSE